MVDVDQGTIYGEGGSALRGKMIHNSEDQGIDMALVGCFFFLIILSYFFRKEEQKPSLPPNFFMIPYNTFY